MNIFTINAHASTENWDETKKNNFFKLFRMTHLKL